MQPGPDYDDRHYDQALSGTVGLDLQLTPDVLAYVAYNHGFKAGVVKLDANGAETRENNPSRCPGARRSARIMGVRPSTASR